LQNKAIVNQPNYAILDKLKEEMTKLKNSNGNQILPAFGHITTIQVPVQPPLPID
jgi:hypothetical protein